MRWSFVDLWCEDIRKLPTREGVYSFVTGVIFFPMLLGLFIGYVVVEVRR